MDIEVISKLIYMVTNSNLKKLEVYDGDMKISLENNIVEVAKPKEGHLNIYDPRQNEVCEKKEEIAVEETQEDDCYKLIKSPIVGTVYLAAGPTKGNFVTVNNKVKCGDTVCIVEAMKLMNEIQSEYNGIVTEVLVKNEDMVEYGTPLFKVKEVKNGDK